MSNHAQFHYETAGMSAQKWSSSGRYHLTYCVCIFKWLVSNDINKFINKFNTFFHNNNSF